MRLVFELIVLDIFRNLNAYHGGAVVWRSYHAFTSLKIFIAGRMFTVSWQCRAI